MKKNWFVRSAVLMFALVIVSCSVFGGTLAKYSWSGGNMTDTARAAKFDFLVGGQTRDVAQTISLFSTAYASDTDDVTEDTVWSNKDPADKVIAPGTSGQLDLTIQNKGEVAITLSAFSITEEQDTASALNIPILYSYVDPASATADDWKTAAQLGSATSLGDVLFADDTATATLYWKWDFTANGDTNDTAIGDIGEDTVTVKVSITVDQVD